MILRRMLISWVRWSGGYSRHKCHVSGFDDQSFVPKTLLAMRSKKTHLPHPKSSQVRPETPGLRRLRQMLAQLRTCPERVLFLDIETTGLSRHYHHVTVVGFSLDGEYVPLVAGDDFTPLKRATKSADVLVTFNGTQFDLPFLRKTVPDIEFPATHIDLRYACRYAGLTGGQKAIEAALGLKRDIDVDGPQAVLLWHRYVAGEDQALRDLISYNYLDVVGMATLLDRVDELLSDRDLFPKVSFAARARALEAQHLVGHRSAREREIRPARFGDLFAGTYAEDAKIIGIDLTGSDKRPTGVAVACGTRVETRTLSTDAEILAFVRDAAPDLVSIDSPLSLPVGRVSVFDDDPGREKFGILRVSERTLKKRGINVYPCLLPSMQRLTLRGIELATMMRREGIPVIESYPGAAQDIVGIARKGAGLSFLVQGLRSFGYQGDFEAEGVTHDELDAITCCMVGSFFLTGRFEALGTEEEDPLVIPGLEVASLPVIVGVSGRIAAGKTTFARTLEAQGFGYLRYSQVVDEVIAERGLEANRDTRQSVGQEINSELGQRWLGRRLLARMCDGRLWVVDGLRFLEDRAFWFEQVGAKFVHVHIEASEQTRRLRYGSEALSEEAFASIDHAPVEREIAGLSMHADATIINNGSKAALEREAASLADRLRASADGT